MNITPRCKMALDYAKDSLSQFGHSQVSSAHLILGLLTLKGGVADNLLRKAGLSIELVQRFLTNRSDPGEQIDFYDGVELGRSAMVAFQRAEEETKARQTTYLGIEHLLLGILSEEKGEALDLLESAHVDRSIMRKAITEEIG